MRLENLTPPALSDRERQLLKLASQGMTDQAIANHLGISLATVGTYWGRIRSKQGPFNRTELVANFLRGQTTEILDHLKTENARLTAEVQAHTTTEQKLKNALDLFRLLISSAPDAIVVVDADGHIQLTNDADDIVFGYARGELSHKHVRELVPKRFHGMHNKLRKQYMSHPEKRPMGEHNATVALRKDGTEFQIAGTLSACDTEDGMLVICMIRDLTK